MTDLSKDQPPGGFRPWMIVPAIGAAMVLAVLLLGLQTNDGGQLPSKLLGKAAPEMDLPALNAGAPGLDTAALQAEGIKIINFWASWCPPCRDEHPFIKALADGGLTVHGINYKDAPDAARGFLSELGDPYTIIGTDRTGRNAIEWGVYGMPETFVVDGEGTVIHKKVGPVLARDLEQIRAIVASATAQK